MGLPLKQLLFGLRCSRKKKFLNCRQTTKIDILINWILKESNKFLSNIQTRGTDGRRVQWLVVKVFKQELICAREHNVKDIRRRARLASCSPVLVRLSKSCSYWMEYYEANFTTVVVDTRLLENKTSEETFPKFPLVLRVIDRSDRNPPITATSVTSRPSVRHPSGLWLVDFDPIYR